MIAEMDEQLIFKSISYKILFDILTNKKIGTNGINADLFLPHIWSFLHNMHCMMLVNEKLDISGFRKITFQRLVNFLWHSQNEVVNIGIFVLKRTCEKRYWHANSVWLKVDQIFFWTYSRFFFFATEMIHLVLEPPALLIYVDVLCSGNLELEKLLHQELLW